MERANALGPAHPSITLLDDNAVAELMTKSDGFYRVAGSEATLSGGGLHAARIGRRSYPCMTCGPAIVPG